MTFTISGTNKFQHLPEQELFLCDFKLIAGDVIRWWIESFTYPVARLLDKPPTEPRPIDRIVPRSDLARYLLRNYTKCSGNNNNASLCWKLIKSQYTAHRTGDVRKRHIPQHEMSHRCQVRMLCRNYIIISQSLAIHQVSQRSFYQWFMGIKLIIRLSFVMIYKKESSSLLYKKASIPFARTSFGHSES